MTGVRRFEAPHDTPRTVPGMTGRRDPHGPRRGASAAAAALLVSEASAALAAGLPSPTASVADFVVALLPGRSATELLGVLRGAARPLVLAGVVGAVLLLGRAIGGLGGPGRSGRLSGRIARAAAVSVVVGLGTAAQLQQRGALALPVLVVGAGAVLVALSVLRTPAAAAEPAATPGERHVGRRAVLLAGMGLALAGSGALLARAAERARSLVTLPSVARPLAPVSAEQDLAPRIVGLSPVHTPLPDFFRIDTALTIPRIDVDAWRLRLTGRVEREVELTFDELIDLGLVEVDATIACVSNEVGGGLVGNARWVGVPLARVLALAEPRADAEQLVGRSADGWTAGFPLEVLDDGRAALVAVGMQGVPLPARHGAPARLVVPGLFGYVSATKWLVELELTGWDEFDAYWVPRGWAKVAPVRPMARIDVPADGASVTAGRLTVAGVAWAPTTGVGGVEVSVDDGPWVRARLAEPLSTSTWLQWWIDLPVEPGRRRLRARMIDTAGRTQPEGPRSVLPDGAEGWHARTVTVAEPGDTVGP